MADRKRIYLCLAHMSEEGIEQKYIKEAFNTNWVVPLGPNVNGFEEDLTRFLACKETNANLNANRTLEGRLCSEESKNVDADGNDYRVVALSSGTAAIHLALIGCGVGPGDEVIVQSFTFCASSHPVTYVGATPVFVDSERETWNMDPELLEFAIKNRIAKTGKKPKAIISVALYGMPYRIDEIMEIADRYEIPVIEDAAEGFGSRYNGRMLGTFGRYGALSFNGNKMITTSGGGALICGPTPTLPSREGDSPTPTLPSREGKSPYMTADPILYDRLKEYARDMRKNPTEAEKVAWSVLCDDQTGYKFRRQHIIGDYIVDFVCLEKMLIVEIDGEYHNDWEQQVDDASRTEWLAIKGFRVIRYTNAQVIASPDMFEREVKAALALQNPLPIGEGWGGANTIMWYATQARESYPYYQHEKIGYNYRMSNICAGIGRGQMTVANKHIEHHKHVQSLYEELLAEIPGITVHSQPKNCVNANANLNVNLNPNANRTLEGRLCSKESKNDNAGKYDSNYWLCTITLAPELRIKGQENAYKSVIKSAVGGAAGVVHEAETATTDCQPNDNVEALRVYLDRAGIEARPVWKPMHCQPVYRQGEVKKESLGMKDGCVVCQTSGSSVAYINGISEEIFKIGMCLPAGPYVSDDDVRYIVEKIREAIVR